MRFLMIIFLILAGLVGGKTQEFTEADTVFGALSPARTWWDVHYYHLSVKVYPDEKRIEGSNDIHYKVLRPDSILQIDLQPPLEIYAIRQNGKILKYDREYFSYFVHLDTAQKTGKSYVLEVEYGGHPHESEQPPWSGGITWETDRHGKPFIANSNQTIGSSIWWPLKDHPSDKPDSMLISINVPPGLMDVSNGRLREIDRHPDGWTTYHWFVSNPLNTYGVNLSIGDYVHFSEVYQGEKGPLDCDYYVLDGHLEQAREHFTDVPRMLEAFEYWLGPYPFYEDGYKLVEVPYLGMEHQSSVAYGNKFMKGYLGRDLSHSGWGLKFDFIIIHESAHEWFANNITYADVADMWIHESFTTYAESLFVEYFYGKKAGAEYVRGLRSSIVNDRPLQGVYGVRSEGSKDMYYKGANVWHTLRQIVDHEDPGMPADKNPWRQILRGLHETFYHQTVLAADIEGYLNEHISVDLTSFFDQYIRDPRMPIFTWWIENGHLKYRYDNVVDGFEMPIRIWISDRDYWLKNASDQWKEWPLPEDPSGKYDIRVDPDFYVAVFPMDG